MRAEAVDTVRSAIAYARHPTADGFSRSTEANSAGRLEERTTVDFWDLTKLLVRRWFVAVPLLLLTAAGAVGLAVTVKPDYIADSYITLVSPRTAAPATSTARNPWLDMGVTALGSAAIYSTQDASVLEPLVRQGYSDNFTMAFDGNTPIIKIEVTAASKQQATATAQELADLFKQSVDALQQEHAVTSDQMITVQRLDKGDNVKSSTTKLKRAVIAVIGAGLLLTIALTATVDAILQRRTRRRSYPAAAPPAGGDGRSRRGTNGSPSDVVANLRDRETELISRPGGDQAGHPGIGRDKRAPSTGEYRSVARDQADETAILAATSDDTAAMPPRPSDATMIIPLPEKEPWAVRDSGGTNRGGSNRR
jgi:capsular polysaccharide biosynthesis protein